jgi:hypothetical protein
LGRTPGFCENWAFAAFLCGKHGLQIGAKPQEIGNCSKDAERTNPHVLRSNEYQGKFMKTLFAIAAVTLVSACAVEETEPDTFYDAPPVNAVNASSQMPPSNDRSVWVNPFDGQTYMRLGNGDMFMNMDTGENYLRVGTTHAMNLETSELEYMGGW